MKILIVNTSDIQGGAARASYRLHRAFIEGGVDSQMLVQSKLLDDYTVIGLQNKIHKALSKLRPTLDSILVRRYKDRKKILFSPSWIPFAGIADKINALNPDVVHLHWIAGGMMRIEDLTKIKAPIVWSLHDMWAFTGGCHYDEGCGSYKKQCGACPVLGSVHHQDLSRKVFERKQTTFSHISNLNIIALSRWLADCAKQSRLFSDTPVFNLPNPINTAIFAPFKKDEARVLLNLPQNKKLILFGAMGATSDPRKGFKELLQALNDVSADYDLVVFGSSQPKLPQVFKQKIHYLGHLHDDISLRILYNAADVMVVPSLQENLSNAIMESLACGTAVVGFAIGGNADLIDHQQTGYLAKAFDTYDLANGIKWILHHENPDQLAQAAREKVLREFDSKIVAVKYLDLYNKIINGDM